MGINLSCSENVAYDTVGSTIKVSAQDSMTCTKNIAYATVRETISNDPFKITTTSHTAVYEEVSVKKYQLHAICIQT